MARSASEEIAAPPPAGTPRAGSVGGAAIRLSDLWKTYGDTIAVAGCDLTIAAGEFCTLLGPSGSGKTTTLMMLAGFAQPDRGEIFVDERPITKLPPQKRDLGVVFQNYALFPRMTVFENVAFPLQMRRSTRAEVRERGQARAGDRRAYRTGSPLSGPTLRRAAAARRARPGDRVRAPCPAHGRAARRPRQEAAERASARDQAPYSSA